MDLAIDILNSNGALLSYTMGDKNLRDKWVRLIKQRMYREGLLGKNMFDK